MLTMLLACEARPGSTVPVGTETAPLVHWVGRAEVIAAGHARYGWPGTGFVVRFEGTGLRVRMEDDARFHTLVVDGQEQPRLATWPGEHRYALARGLPAGEHTIELYRRTEGSLGPTVVLAFELDGTFLPPPEPRHRIEVIGDSISCGYGNEGRDETCHFSADTENHYLTYAAVSARRLGAELSTIAWSGKGVVYNYLDDKVEPLPELYDRAVPTERGAWAFETPADLVLVNLGTNDFSTDDDPEEALFVERYVDLLARVRVHHPRASILCTVAPMLPGAEVRFVTGYIDRAIAVRKREGDARVERIDLSVPVEGLGCDHHPSLATHAAMADRLTPIAREKLP